MAHQFAQDQQVHPTSGEIGAVGVPQPVRSDPNRTGAFPVDAEDLAHPGLGHRSTGRRTAQHHEALDRGAAGRAFMTSIVGDLDEEATVDRNDPLTAALAEHPHLAKPDTDIGQPERASLTGA